MFTYANKVRQWFNSSLGSVVLEGVLKIYYLSCCFLVIHAIDLWSSIDRSALNWLRKTFLLQDPIVALSRP